MIKFFGGILFTRARRGWPGLILKWGSVPALCLVAVMLWARLSGADPQIGLGTVQGGGGSTFTGGTIPNPVIIQGTAPYIQLDPTEAVSQGTQIDGVYFFARNSSNGGDALYNVMAGLSYNCKWDPTQLSGAGGWVKTLGGSPGRGCWMFGTSISGDFVLRAKTNNLDATGTVYTDAAFGRAMEFYDMSSGLIVFDKGTSFPGGTQLTSLGALISTFTDASLNPIFRLDPTTGLPQWVNNGSGKPTCAVGTRGGVWYVPGAAGVLDTFEVCRKDAANVYAWVTLF